jgi:hypothetical protein
VTLPAQAGGRVAAPDAQGSQYIRALRVDRLTVQDAGGAERIRLQVRADNTAELRMFPTADRDSIGLFASAHGSEIAVTDPTVPEVSPALRVRMSVGDHPGIAVSERNAGALGLGVSNTRGPTIILLDGAFSEVWSAP